MDLRAPFPAFGGKSRAAPLVWERFGTCVNYVEPFCFSAAVLLACPEDRRPRVETINDVNGFVSNFWRSVRADPEAVAREADYPVIETDLHARHRWLLAQAAGLRERLDADPDYFDAKVAAWWVWGASAWIGSGWCEEGRGPRVQLPSLAGATDTGGPTPNYGGGIHAAGMREPSKQLPALSNGQRAFDGMGVHSKGMREPSRQLPDLGSPAPDRIQIGRGIHAAGARAPSRKLPDVGASRLNGEAHTNHGKGIHGLSARTALYDIFAALSERLRYVRVACGDWSRICTPAVTYRHGLTAVFLDPPYPKYQHLYGSTEDVTPAVRAWALEMGARRDMRVCYCGYEGDAPELEQAGWEVVEWAAKGGYGNQRSDDSNVNRHRERLWFSPSCLRPGVNVGQLDMFATGT